MRWVCGMQRETWLGIRGNSKRTRYWAETNFDICSPAGYVTRRSRALFDMCRWSMSMQRMSEAYVDMKQEDFRTA